jgi:hypothetical protein
LIFVKFRDQMPRFRLDRHNIHRCESFSLPSPSRSSAKSADEIPVSVIIKITLKY